MEFTNYEREFMAALQRHTIEELRSINKVYSDYEIETYEHTMDNTTLNCYFGVVLDKMKGYGYTFLGTGKAPYTHNGRSAAVVFENNKTFEKYWYHTEIHIVEWWQEQVALFLGEKEF